MRRAFHEEVPTTKITTDTAFVFVFVFLRMTMLRAKPYTFAKQYILHMQNYMFCTRYILLHMQKHILVQNI